MELTFTTLDLVDDITGNEPIECDDFTHAIQYTTTTNFISIYKWVLVTGVLPTGFTLDTLTGVISGKLDFFENQPFAIDYNIKEPMLVSGRNYKNNGRPITTSVITSFSIKAIYSITTDDLTNTNISLPGDYSGTISIGSTVTGITSAVVGTISYVLYDATTNVTHLTITITTGPYTDGETITVDTVTIPDPITATYTSGYEEVMDTFNITIHKNNNVDNLIFIVRYLDADVTVVNGVSVKHTIVINGVTYDKSTTQECIANHPGPFPTCDVTTLLT